MQILDIQNALHQQGFNPGELDGVWGRRTIAAVEAFQKVHGLEPDGVVGPQTIRALAGASYTAETDDVPKVWYEEAVNLVGTREFPGQPSNKVIINWAKTLKLDYKSDDIPWCGLFVAHCVGSTLPGETLPPNPLGARNWLKFGDSSAPVSGAILVFWRESRNGGKGHVGFYRSEDDSSYHVLGGNQSDSVSIARVGKNRLLGARWPRTAARLTGRVVRAEAEGPLSHKEA